MTTPYIPVLPLLTGGSVVGTPVEAFINGVLNFMQSPAFYIIVAILILLVQMFQSIGTKLAIKCDKRIKH